MAGISTEQQRFFQLFYRNAQLLLSEQEQDYLAYALKDYQTYRSVEKLMRALITCLNTPAKLDLLRDIRNLIPSTHQRKFDSIAPYSKMAHPFPRQNHTQSLRGPTAFPAAAPKMNGSLPVSGAKAGTFRVVNFNKTAQQVEDLGFTIRGGKEFNMGVYVAVVRDESPAQFAGLVENDQIFEVNGISFEHIALSSAAKLLSSLNKLKLVVKGATRKYVYFADGIPEEDPWYVVLF